MMTTGPRFRAMLLTASPLALLLGGCATMADTATPAARSATAGVADPDLWPAVRSPHRLDPAMERRIDTLIARMSVEDKVGQIIQADISAVTPADVRRYRLGSVLNGGNSGPFGDDLAPPARWLALADEFWDAAMGRGGFGIPIVWGTDAVHGNNNVPGATVFPHNIGLGAARDPGLIEAIGRVTAIETSVAAQEWSFAPTLAVVRDDRWGRTYESYSEEPSIVASYAPAVVRGLQGAIGSADYLGAGRVAATAKHFLADGGTQGGRDQGDAQIDERELIDIHAAGYPPAIEAGALTVMASFSSWQGVKHHGNESLLTGVLKDRWGFDGVLVSDWNAHGQVPGCTNSSCPQALNAGLDMYMAPDSWRDLLANTITQVKAGEVPMARLDDAVRRVLRLKMRLGLFEAGRPSTRPNAGRFELLGAPEHRALARRAVRQSMVLLKNDGALPIDPGRNILVVGEGADSISKQSGGWTLTWQGAGVPNSAFPNGQSIWGGIDEAVRAAGGRATYSADGRYTTRPDVAIVVFGEDPYAEFVGDRPSLDYAPGERRDLALMQRLRADGIPVVAVFLSGRPMWVNPEINAADAFVAAFLPGSEGGGVADMLLRGRGGAAAHDFSGRLSFSWPKRADQGPLNVGDRGYDPLFPVGYGLSYAQPGRVPRLSEQRPEGAAGLGPLFGSGRVPTGWTLALVRDGATDRVGVAGTSGSIPNLTIAGIDRNAQEDARRFVWTGPAAAVIDAAPPIDIAREANGELSLVVTYRVAGGSPATLSLFQADAGGRRHAVRLSGLTAGDWSTVAVPLRCFAAAGLDMTQITTPFGLSASAPLTFDLADVRVASASVPQDRCDQ